MEELIKKALKKVGLSEDLWEKISVTSETEIESAVNKLIRTERESVIREALKKAGIPEGELDKLTQSVSDNRVSDAIKTHDDKLKADKILTDEEKRIAEEKAAKEKEDADALAKKKADDMNKLDDKDKRIAELTDLVGTVVQSVKDLTEKISGVESGLSEKERTVVVSDALKTAGIAPEWSKFITEKDPEKITEQVTALKGRYDAETQINNDKIIADGGTPAAKAGSDTFADDAIAEHAKNVSSGEVTTVAGKASQQILSQQAVKVPE